MRHRKPPKLFRREGTPFRHYDFQIAGRRYPGSTERTNKAEAEAVHAEKWATALADAKRLIKSEREPMTVDIAVRRWWHEIGQHGAETDLVPHLHWLVKHLGGSTFLHKIKGNDVARLVALRREDRVHVAAAEDGAAMWRPVSARTINRTVTKLLRRIMRTAVKRWNVDIPAMPEWSEFLLEEKRHLPRFLSYAEQDRLEEVERPELTAAREFALMSGLRLREVVDLKKFNVDFAGRVIHLIQKDDKPRVLAISDNMAALLRSLWHDHETAIFTFEAKRTRRCPKTGTMFVKGKRYPLTYWGLTISRRRDWKKAGVDANFHDMRRTAARRTKDATGSIYDAKDLLGHDDVRTTMLYIGETIDVERQREAMNRRDLIEAEMREKSRKESRTPSPKVVNALKGK